MMKRTRKILGPTLLIAVVVVMAFALAGIAPTLMASVGWHDLSSVGWHDMASVGWHDLPS